MSDLDKYSKDNAVLLILAGGISDRGDTNKGWSSVY